jgi:ribosomal protein S12 methylthiotransferase accessory factor
VTILHLEMDHGIPTILSVLHHSSPKAPAFLVAASSDLDPEEAVRKSLEELAHTRRLALFLKATQAPVLPGTHHDQILEQDSHIHFYCDHANAPLTEFLFSSDRHICFQDIDNRVTGNPQTDLSLCIERIASVGHRVLLADLTTPDVKDLGLWVARAVIPGFHPLCMGHIYRALGGTRLWTIPQKLGHPGVSQESGDNPLAHPYP